MMLLRLLEEFIGESYDEEAWVNCYVHELNRRIAAAMASMQQ